MIEKCLHSRYLCSIFRDCNGVSNGIDLPRQVLQLENGRGGVTGEALGADNTLYITNLGVGAAAGTSPSGFNSNGVGGFNSQLSNNGVQDIGGGEGGFIPQFGNNRGQGFGAGGYNPQFSNGGLSPEFSNNEVLNPLFNNNGGQGYNPQFSNGGVVNPLFSSGGVVNNGVQDISNLVNGGGFNSQFSNNGGQGFGAGGYNPKFSNRVVNPQFSNGGVVNSQFINRYIKGI